MLGYRMMTREAIDQVRKSSLPLKNSNGRFWNDAANSFEKSNNNLVWWFFTTFEDCVAFSKGKDPSTYIIVECEIPEGNVFEHGKGEYEPFLGLSPLPLEEQSPQWIKEEFTTLFFDSNWILGMYDIPEEEDEEEDWIDPYDLFFSDEEEENFLS